MHIEKFRNIIEANDFRCLEIHNNVNNEIRFHIMTDNANKTIAVIYSRDKNGILGFDKAIIINGNFDFSFNYIESMLMCGQCSYIKHYRGYEVVKLPESED